MNVILSPPQLPCTKMSLHSEIKEYNMIFM